MIMSKELAKQLREAVANASRPVADQLGLALSGEHASYDPTLGDCVVKLTFTVKLTEDFDPEKAKFQRMAPMFGLKPEHYGSQLVVRGETWTLVGLAPGSPRFPVLARRANGKVYKLEESSLHNLKKV